MKRQGRPKAKRCSRTGKVIFRTKLDAKIALAERFYKDKGEIRFYPCQGHYHLTSEARRR